MELLVDGAEVFPIHVGINLSGGEIGVSQHLLDGTQICAAFEQVSRETMPQGVRSDPLGDAGTLGRSLHYSPGAYPRKRLPSRVE